MSASRIKTRIKPRKNPLPPQDDSPLSLTAPSAPRPSNVSSSASPAPLRPIPAATAGRSSLVPAGNRPPVSRKGLLKAPKDARPSTARSTPPPRPKPISISSSSEDEDEDDLEEVPIPGGASSHAGPSSPYPNTSGAGGTPGTIGITDGAGTPAGSGPEDIYASSDEDEGDGQEEEVIRLEIGGESEEQKARRIALALRKKPMTSKDRAVRIEAHKTHVIALLASARIRNRWSSNLLLRARLLSLLPHPLVSAFSIPPSRFPDRAQRSRLFFDALQSLVTWWSQVFFDIPDINQGLRTRPWDEVQPIADRLPRLTKADVASGGFSWIRSAAEVGKGKGKAKADDVPPWMEILEDGANGERLRTVNSLMKKALQQEGSRDTSAILFVSLARACGLGARMVVSLQPVPWRAEKVVAKKKSGAGKGGKTLASKQGMGTSDDDEEDEDDMEEVPIPGIGEVEGAPGDVMDRLKKRNPLGKKLTIRAGGKRRLQDPADVYRLRQPKPAKPAAAATASPSPAKAKLGAKIDLSHQPPVFWAEIFSRSDQRWIPVDPIRGTIRKKSHFEPGSDNGPIRLSYVVAFEEDGYARDVTLRYAKSFGAKTSKIRVPLKRDEPDWWAGIVRMLERPNRLNRDELEDAELETSQVSEAMPMHLNGFKDHPIYVLERHLKREEVLHPKREVGRFRGEPVFRRAHVQATKTAENWMRIGRRVKPRQEPLKWVKQRAVTLQKRRQQELAKQEGEEVLQGLYAEWQTEIYIPPPIQDGIVPQNSFGNIDLYAPTMLPVGAVHLPFKGIAKIAKQLGISYAEACTGFEFKKQRAIPVITGIVVAAENEAMTLEAYWESAAAQEARERAKAQDRALKRWAKLINGLRVRRRLQAEYGDGEGLQGTQSNPLALVQEDPVQRAERLKDADRAQKGQKTVLAVLNAGKKGQQAWEDRVAARENGHAGEDDEEMEELEEVKVEPPALEPDGSATVAEAEATSPDEQDSDDEELEEVEVKPSSTALNHDSTEGPMDVDAPRSNGYTSMPIEDAAAPVASRKSTTQRARRQPVKTATTPTTRSLRSRDPNTAEKQREGRARLRRALRDASAELSDE